MPAAQHLAALALTSLVPGIAAEAAGSIARLLADRLADHSQRLTRALERAGGRAWQALEVALAGGSCWQPVQGRLAGKEDESLAAKIRPFLDTTATAELRGQPNYRQQCLGELQEARKAGVLAGALDSSRLADQANSFIRFAD